MMNWSIELKKWRLENNYTIAEAAHLLGVGARSWASWEAGEHIPRPKVRRRFLELLEKQKENGKSV